MDERIKLSSKNFRMLHQIAASLPKYKNNDEDRAPSCLINFNYNQYCKRKHQIRKW